MRYFVFSDAHGHLKALKKKLAKKGFNEENDEHILISCGDNFDRGHENYEMFLFLENLRKKNRVILIKGNHELLLEKIIQRGYAINMDYAATVRTLEDFMRKLNYKDIKDSILWLIRNARNYFDSMKWYYELGDFIFVHSWMPKDYKNALDTTWKEVACVDGTEAYHQEEIIPNKIIVNGHRFSWIYHNKFSNNPIAIDSYRAVPKDYFLPYYDKGLIAIDTCTFYSHKVNVLVIDKIGDKYILNKDLSD